MILIAFLFWILGTYVLVDKYLDFNNLGLKTILSALFSLSALSMLFILSVFLHIDFMFFIIGCGIIPLPILIKNFSHLKKIANLQDIRFSSITVLVLACLLIYTYLFFLKTVRWGHFDAWATWNMHAKFFTYPKAFIHLYMHPERVGLSDYPLMLPGIVAMVWKSIGSFSFLVPMIIAYFISLSIPLLLFFGLREKKARITGLILFGILTCSTILTNYTAHQMADSLLALFILLSIILLNQKSENSLAQLFFTGFIAASCTWIKNEGILFFLIFIFYFILKNYKNRVHIFRLMMGAAFPLVVLFVFKYFYAPPSYFISENDWSFFNKLIDIDRHFIIMKLFLSTILIKYGLLCFIVILIMIIDLRFFISTNFLIIGSLILGYYLFI